MLCRRVGMLSLCALIQEGQARLVGSLGRPDGYTHWITFILTRKLGCWRQHQRNYPPRLKLSNSVQRIRPPGPSKATERNLVLLLFWDNASSLYLFPESQHPCVSHPKQGVFEPLHGRQCWGTSLIPGHPWPYAPYGSCAFVRSRIWRATAVSWPRWCGMWRGGGCWLEAWWEGESKSMSGQMCRCMQMWQSDTINPASLHPTDPDASSNISGHVPLRKTEIDAEATVLPLNKDL